MPTPNPSTRREYKGAAAATTLQNAMTSSDTSFLLVAATNWPTGAVGKFIVTINRGQSDEEKILCDTQTSRTVACLLANRGFDGTTAQGHAAGATVECTISAFDADEWNQHTNATTGVHGIAGAVVGTTDTQTLTGKTLGGASCTGATAFPNGSIDANGFPLLRKPHFSGYNTTGAALTSGVWSTITVPTTESTYGITVTTNNKFQPNQPGIYRATVNVYLGTPATNAFLLIQKNGTAEGNGTSLAIATVTTVTSSFGGTSLTTTVALNGTTDFVWSFVQPFGGASAFAADRTGCNFNMEYVSAL